MPERRCKQLVSVGDGEVNALGCAKLADGQVRLTLLFEVSLVELQVRHRNGTVHDHALRRAFRLD